MNTHISTHTHTRIPMAHAHLYTISSMNILDDDDNNNNEESKKRLIEEYWMDRSTFTYIHTYIYVYRRGCVQSREQECGRSIHNEWPTGGCVVDGQVGVSLTDRQGHRPLLGRWGPSLY
eukprot:GHVU01040585.1.p4 GENE.GHVU01040585.1~~GHVU01040585.1.p4  ORF type:complete len:119 (-),score=5.10 GHVU01040585.1:1079-1435(-)